MLYWITFPIAKIKILYIIDENLENKGCVLTMYTEKIDELAPEIHLGIRKKIYFGVKRIFDIFISVFGLVIFSPIFLCVAIAIKLDSEGPVIFTQDRIGKNGKFFKFYKFRSMVMGADDILFEMLKEETEQSKEYQINKKMKDDPRITKVGKFIRKTSIDELPQLINVLKGDMSLIGNRPYLPREIVDMGEYYEQVIASKPGLTGLWQTSGRSNTTFEERLKLESEYSEKMSLGLDIKIFFKTFSILFKQDGAD